jgi:hypothetical protein
VVVRDPLEQTSGKYPTVFASLANRTPKGFDPDDDRVDENLFQFAGIVGPRDPNDIRPEISIADSGDLNVIAGRAEIRDGDELVVMFPPREGRVGQDLNPVDDADVYPQVEPGMSRRQPADAVYGEVVPLHYAVAKGLLSTTDPERTFGTVKGGQYKRPKRRSAAETLGTSLCKFAAQCAAVVLAELSRNNRIQAVGAAAPDLTLGVQNIDTAVTNLGALLSNGGTENAASLIRQLITQSGNDAYKARAKAHLRQFLLQIHRAAHSSRHNRIGYALENARPGQFCLTRVVAGMRNRGAFGNRAAEPNPPSSD